MNKKRLSVVMAGAMLASSVAPVLAADVTAQTMPADQRGLLIEGIRNLMKSKMLDGTNDTDDSAFGFTMVKKGESDRNSDGTLKSGVILYNNLSGLSLLQATLTEEKTVRVYEKETRVDEYGKLTDIAKDGTEIKGEVLTYKTQNELEELASNIQDKNNAEFKNNKFIKGCQWVNQSKHEEGLKIILNAVEDPNASELVNKTFVLKVGDKQIDFKKAFDKNGLQLKNIEEDVQKFDHFDYKYDQNTSIAGQELKGLTLKQEVNLVGKDVKTDSFLVEDLFDGLMLTEKGTELFETYKYDKPNEGLDYELEKLELLPGIYQFNIVVIDTEKTTDNVVKTITVRGLNKDSFDILYSWFKNKKFNVGVLAGDNRYETAAKIAKEQASITEVAKDGHIVLVNGEALVDGLAAAPLAASLVKNPKSAAPVLLTKSNTIPKETLAYLRELVKAQTIAGLEKIHIDVVGGEAVVSKDVVDTLKGIGFDVVRHGGDNREETSLEVFDASQENGRDTIYVVGADGEADAMSIAPVAAGNGHIIVAKKGGLSKVALRAIEKANKNVVIVGGEKSVSTEEEAKLKEIAKENKTTVERVAGKNRQATNAAIIEKYYTLNNTDAVVVSKDGKKNKLDLVDALTAANLASKVEAPIVLATDSLSKEQVNELNKKAVSAKALYQIGGGVSRDNVMAKLAELLQLPTKIN